FHLSAHKLPCFVRFSLNFVNGAGQVDGEILETLWAPFNKISPTALFNESTSPTRNIGMIT
ncbi:hypothetical protein EDD22DRAFT_788602, partial [Suillus occidentalis]